MSEIREMAARIVLRAAYEMAKDNESDVSAVYNCQYGMLNDLRERAMHIVDGDADVMPDTPPEPDEMERLIGESGLSMDMLDRRARESYGGTYSTLYERYVCALGWCVDDMLGWQ